MTCAVRDAAREGFGSGRELRFRITEVEAWLARLEQDDDQRHFARGL